MASYICIIIDLNFSSTFLVLCLPGLIKTPLESVGVSPLIKMESYPLQNGCNSVKLVLILTIAISPFAKMLLMLDGAYLSKLVAFSQKICT